MIGICVVVIVMILLYVPTYNFTQMADEWFMTKVNTGSENMSPILGYYDGENFVAKFNSPTGSDTTYLLTYPTYTETCIKSHQVEKVELAREFCYSHPNEYANTLGLVCDDVECYTTSRSGDKLYFSIKKYCDSAFKIDEVIKWNETVCDAWALCKGDCEGLTK